MALRNTSTGILVNLFLYPQLQFLSCARCFLIVPSFLEWRTADRRGFCSNDALTASMFCAGANCFNTTTIRLNYWVGLFKVVYRRLYSTSWRHSTVSINPEFLAKIHVGRQSSYRCYYKMILRRKHAVKWSTNSFKNWTLFTATPPGSIIPLYLAHAKNKKKNGVAKSPDLLAGPVYSHNKNKQDECFLKFISVKKSTWFGQTLLSSIRSLDNVFTAADIWPVPPWPRYKTDNVTTMTNTNCCEYGSWWWTISLSETCRAVYQNKVKPLTPNYHYIGLPQR